MGRSSIVSRVPYTGTGAVSTYTFPFHIAVETDLLVTEELIATGVQTTNLITTDYTVLASGVDNPNGGSITLVAGNLPTTKKIVIRRKVPETQVTDIRNQGPFFPEAHEDEFDKRNDIDQQQQDEIDRSTKFAETVDVTLFDTTIPVPVASKYIRINSTNDGLELADLVTGSNISLPSPGLAYMAQTSAGVFTARTFTKTGDLILTNGDGQSGNTNISSATIDTKVAANPASSKNVEWSCASATQVVIATGSIVRGIDSGKYFTFTTGRTFDITGSAGDLGALNTGSEASDTFYYLIALLDTTAALAPHIIGVTEANYASFTTASLTGNYSVYNDYKRMGSIGNNGSSNFREGFYINGRFFFSDDTNSVSTNSTSLGDIDFSPSIPLISRSAAFLGKATGGANQTVVSIKGSGSVERIITETGQEQGSFSIWLSSAQVFQAKVSANTTEFHPVFYDDDLQREGQ